MGLLVLIILGALNAQAARVCLPMDEMLNFTRVGAPFDGRPAQVLADDRFVTDGGTEFYGSGIASVSRSVHRPVDGRMSLGATQ